MDINIFESIIEELIQDSNTFDSHDVIKKIIWSEPVSYANLLIKHENVTNAHAEISNFLRNKSNDLHIEKVNCAHKSPDIFGNDVECALWKYIKY